LFEHFGEVGGREHLLYEGGERVFGIGGDFLTILAVAVGYSEEVHGCGALNIGLKQICILIQLF